MPITGTIDNLDAADIAYISSLINMTSLEITENVTINTNGDIGNNFLEDSPNIQSVKIKSLVEVGVDFCRNCPKITTVELPYLKTVGARFCRKNASTLITLKLPRAETIGNQFCRNADGLKEVILPKAKSFGSYIFRGIGGTVQLTVGTTIPTTVGNSFTNYNPLSKDGSVKVSKSVMAAYDNDDAVVDGLWHGWFLLALPNPQIPQTGYSNTLTWVLLAGGLLIMTAGMIIIKKRKKN